MSTLEAHIQFMGQTLFDWKDDLNGPCNILNVASLNIINNSLLTPQKFKFYAHHYTNQEHSDGGEGFFCVEELINIRQTLQAQKLKINAEVINNEGGHLLGQHSNDVSVFEELRNNGGEIGSEGRTSLSLSLNAVTVEDLGTIRGVQTFILDKSLRKKALTFKKGSLQGTKKVTIQTPFFKGLELDIKTPFCVMNVEDFCLTSQTQCARLILSLKDSQNFISNHAFKTEGSFEIWQKGLSTQEDVDRAMAERFPEGGPVPDFEQTIHLKSPLSTQFLRIFVPKAKVRLGEETGPLLDVLMEKGNTDIAATIFDLEKGTFVALNSHIHAPGGITLGRLETDHTQEVFTTFSWHGQNSWSHHLGNHIVNVTYEFLGHCLQNVYDGYCLARFPVVHGNGSSFLTRHTSVLKGPLIQRAIFETNDLHLSSKEPLLEASKTTIYNNLTFQEVKKLTLQPVSGIMRYGFFDHIFKSCAPFSSNFVNSEGSTLRVGGNLFSETPLTIINKGSILHFKNKTPSIILQDEAITLKGASPFVQKTYGGTKEDRDELARPDLTSGWGGNPWFTCSFGVGGGPGGVGTACSFLSKTNNFAGAQNTFLPTTTFGEGVVFQTHEPVPLNLSTPLAIVLIGQEGRVIGLANPHTVQAQSPLSNLMEAPLNFGTVKMNLPSEAFSPSGLFKFQERFWFDIDGAKRFYKSIQDHIVLFSPEGIFQKLDRPLLTLSPKLLLERIQEAVQKKLGRGYVDHGKPIDETYVRELHENATEHLRSLPGSVLRGTGLALLRQDAVNIPLSQKPLIYYKEVVDETGEVSLSPEMSFPEHLLNPMGSVRNAKIHVGMLLAISEGMTLNDAQKCFEGSPAQLAILSAIIQDRPNLLALMDAEGPGVLALEGEGLSSQELAVSKISHGPLALHGDFETNAMAVLPAGKLILHGDVRIDTINTLLASLFDDVETKFWVECIRHSKGYYDVLKGCVEIDAKGALCISAGRDLSLVATKTRSKLISYFQARRDTFDIPAVLQSHFSETSGSKKNKRTETRTSSVSIASQHTSEGAFVSSAGRHNTHQGNKVEAESIMEHGGLSHQQLPSYNTLSASSTSSQKGSFGAKKSSQSSYASAISIPCERISRSTVMHLAPHQALVGSTITAEGQVFLLTLGDLGEIQFRVRRDTTQSSTVSSASSGFWSVQKQSGDGLSTLHSVVINSPFPIKVSTPSLIIEEASGSPSIKDKIETTAQIESLLAQIETQSSHTSHSGPTALTAGLVGLTIAIATQGWCTGLMEELIGSQAVVAGSAAATTTAATVAAGSTTAAVVTGSSAAMGSLLGSLGGALLTTKGDIVASLKQTLHPDSLKGALAVGITAGLCHQFIPSQEALNAASKTVPTAAATAPTLTSHVLPHVGHAALQIPIETAVHTVVGTKSIGEAFRGAALNGAAQAVHRSAANALGANATDLGVLGHKIGHMAAATAGAHISSGGKDFTNSLINGANAVLGEMLMETLVDRELETAALKEAHPDLSAEELNQHFQKQTANRKHLAIWTSGALAGLSGGDVGTAASLANTAIDHNYMMTAKKLFYGNEEEETTADESFLSRYTEDSSDPEEGSQFGAAEEKKVRAGLSGASSRPHTQQEYARALDPSGFIAKSVGRRYEGGTPVHAALSEVLTPQRQSEVRASVQRFDAFMAETEALKSSQRTQGIGEDFRGKAQAAAASTMACEEEISELFNTYKEAKPIPEGDFCLWSSDGDVYAHQALADETAEDIAYWSWSLKQKIRKWHSQEILNTTTFLENKGFDVPYTAFECQRAFREGVLFFVPETAFEVKTAPLTLLGGRIISPMIGGITKSITTAGRKGIGLLKSNVAVAAAFEQLTQKSSRLIDALNLEKKFFLPPLALEEAGVRTLKVSQTVEKRAAGDILSRDTGRFGLEESSFLKPSGGLSTEKRLTALQDGLGEVGKRQEASAASQALVEAEKSSSRVRKINNRMPINAAEHANKIYPLEKLPPELRAKYPHSVPFTGTGHPDFSRYAIKKVQIQMTGIRKVDDKLANQAAGLNNAPQGFTWHHHHDGETMLLVPRDIHKAIEHTGGVAVIKGKTTK